MQSVFRCFCTASSRVDPEPCGVGEYVSALAHIMTLLGPHRVLFTTDRDKSSGQPWCPDCALRLLTLGQPCWKHYYAWPVQGHVAAAKQCEQQLLCCAQFVSALSNAVLLSRLAMEVYYRYVACIVKGHRQSCCGSPLQTSSHLMTVFTTAHVCPPSACRVHASLCCGVDYVGPERYGRIPTTLSLQMRSCTAAAVTVWS